MVARPELCFLACDTATGTAIGVIVCKQDLHRGKRMRGYIAMLSIRPDYRKRGIGKTLSGTFSD